LVVRLPPFGVERPATWFAKAEAQISLDGITNDTTKFFYVISQLDLQSDAEIKGIITSSAQKDSYITLKT
jgi:hypothetical protein